MRRCGDASVASDTGAGSVLGLALLGALVVLALAAVGLGGALAERQRVIGAADNTALAAADAARGLVPGSPCPVAEQVAEANRTQLHACEVDGYVVTVEVGASVAGVLLRARATAGPPPRRAVGRGSGRPGRARPYAFVRRRRSTSTSPAIKSTPAMPSRSSPLTPVAASTAAQVAVRVIGPVTGVATSYELPSEFHPSKA